MHFITGFFNSLSPEQLALALGAITFLGHTVLRTIDKQGRLTTDFNKFLSRFMTVVVPLSASLLQVAGDPTAQAFVHVYAPSLAFFFTGYQGLYTLVQSVANRIENVQSLLNEMDNVQSV